VLFLTLVAIVPLSHGDESLSGDALRKQIATDLDAAALACDAAIDKSRKRVSTQLETKLTLAKSRGDIDAVDAVSHELKAFAEDDRMPTLVSSLSFERLRERELSRLVSAYDNCIKRFTQAEMLDDARRLTDARNEVQSRLQKLLIKGFLGQQLLRNPGAEEPPTRRGIKGWQVVDGHWRRATEDPDPFSGSGYFRSFGTRRCRLAQIIPVKEVDHLIDASSLNVTFTAKMWRLHLADGGRIVVDFLDARRNVLLSIPSETPGKGKWQAVSIQGPVPVGTRYLRPQIGSWVDKKDRSKQPDVAFDGLDLRFEFRKDPQSGAR